MFQFIFCAAIIRVLIYIPDQRYVRAMYDFSSRASDDLSFKQGDLMMLIDDS